MRRWHVAAGLFALLAATVSVQPGAIASSRTQSASQCLAGESVVYSCRFGSRIGSVCAGGGGAHYRFGKPGRAEIDIASAADWSNVRIGMVTGQQGGSQHHIRFTQGDSHYIVYHGVDGQLADRPGRTYSGVTQVLGPNGEWEGNSWNCKRGAQIDPGFEDTVAAMVPEVLRPGLIETRGGAFDGWF